MTTKELMVGDYITFSDVQNDNNCPKLKVVIIDKEDVYVSNDGDPVVDVLDPKELAGIPITPEILEKNGFKKQSPGEYSTAPRWFWGKEGKRDGALIVISFYDPPVNGVTVLTKINTESSKDGGVNNLHSCDIEYVHQLQQAIRICRIEKNIEL